MEPSDKDDLRGRLVACADLLLATRPTGRAVYDLCNPCEDWDDIEASGDRSLIALRDHIDSLTDAIGHGFPEAEAMYADLPARIAELRKPPKLG